MMLLKNRRLLIILASISLLLLIPFIAMQFTPEVNWKVNDFLVAASILLATGFGIEFLLRKVKTPSKRTLLVVGVLTLVVLVWMELAVGLFGTPIAGS